MPENASFQQRIAEAAIEVFARLGFHGATTKDIAQSAAVSEGSIFRYYPTKRDLFFAAVDCALGRLSFRADLLDRVVMAQDSRQQLGTLFALIVDTLSRQPETVRLLQFSALEFGEALQPVYRRHLGVLFGVLEKSMASFADDSTRGCTTALVPLLSLVGCVVMLLNYYSVLTGTALPVNCTEAPDICAQLCAAGPNSKRINAASVEAEPVATPVTAD